VLISGRREDRLQALAAELGDRPPVVLDVTDRASIRPRWTACRPNGAIDVLINNAGLALGVTPAHESSLEDWDTMIATNVSGLVAMTRAILPGMVERNSGTIINWARSPVKRLTRAATCTAPPRPSSNSSR
jgi:serine 3-dehydrogenase/3-hydroxy acid dehydrogenase/malonic semialdehyde reductase